MGVRKEKKVYAKVALKAMGIARSGRSRGNARYINARKNMVFNFVGYVMNFHVMNCSKKYIGILTLLNT